MPTRYCKRAALRRARMKLEGSGVCGRLCWLRNLPPTVVSSTAVRLSILTRIASHGDRREKFECQHEHMNLQRCWGRRLGPLWSYSASPTLRLLLGRRALRETGLAGQSGCCVPHQSSHSDRGGQGSQLQSRNGGDSACPGKQTYAVRWANKKQPSSQDTPAQPDGGMSEKRTSTNDACVVSTVSTVSTEFQQSKKWASRL